jgi:hypothetical protein
VSDNKDVISFEQGLAARFRERSDYYFAKMDAKRDAIVVLGSHS